jgi:hypothetical protein
MRDSDVNAEIDRMVECRREKDMVKIENCKQKPAKGTKGMLLYTMNNEYVFRVYKEDHTFIDYDILHCDLDVTIDSDDAVFYDFEDGRSILDHSYVMAGESHHSDKGYELGTEEGYNEFVKHRNKL